MADAQSFLTLLKDRLPKHVSLLLSGGFFVATLLVNVAVQKTHYADIQAQQARRISALEQTIKRDLATRREVDDVKATVERIEDKLDNALGHRRAK